MKRIIKNVTGTTTIKAKFRGKTITIKPKHSMSFDSHNEEQEALYNYLMLTYGGLLVDRTTHYDRQLVEALCPFCGCKNGVLIPHQHIRCLDCNRVIEEGGVLD